MSVKKKKKLIMELGDSASNSVNHSHQYSRTKQWWQCEVESENPDGLTNEYEITATNKALLDDFISQVKKEILAINADDNASWNFRIYRIVNKR